MSSRPIFSLRLPKDTKDTLAHHGYSTLGELLSATPSSIALALGISVEDAEEIIQQVQRPATQNPSVPLTQSAAAVIKATRKFSTRWPPLDKLLDGGLMQGHILEVSGPPGSPKETIAIDIVTSFIEGGESVIFIDSQNMTSPTNLRDRLSGCPASSLRSLHYSSILNATEMMVFLHSINNILDSMPKVALLVLNSFSFPFSTLPNPFAKSGILEQVRQILARILIIRNLTVVVTSQLSNKMLQEDEPHGSPEEKGKVVMVPQLGTSYLPSGRSHRILLALDSPISGIMYLLPSSSPSTTTKEPVLHEPYSISIT
ncbi:hypothetical protein P691DRAFT_736197 [Macrolepiota fuliginosa MF-IS2]|uniref:RecA family profile 1 domain-containing protein n=1 Tax=Macrolepiota fuliginosa MF-IS2 TaxID=1400762 RepID=A0A9P6C0Q6_9AGAR|nr:hypothetical protein P691DRAFT_736197 [Macrolepiota fuliginosa MF-IS2]